MSIKIGVIQWAVVSGKIGPLIITYRTRLLVNLCLISDFSPNVCFIGVHRNDREAHSGVRKTAAKAPRQPKNSRE